MKRARKSTAIILTLLCAFVFTAMPVFAAIDESEPNDSKATANTIKVGTTVYGYVENNGDDDWYKFKAPISGTAKVYLHLDYATDGSPWNGYGDTLLDVYDSNTNYLVGARDYYDTDGGDSVTFGVKAGKTYYMMVYPHTGNCEYHFKVSYLIGRTSIARVTPKNNAFYIKWNKKDKADFYQVKFTKKSTYQDYAWTKGKTVKVGSNSSSKTMSNLRNKTTYYVKVRVARTIDGKTYYSSWSKKKAVTTK